MSEPPTALPDYEAMLESFYRGFLDAGDVCMDIGAHEGRHMYPMLERIGATGRILAFEPIPDLAAGLTSDVHRKGLKDVVSVYQLALGERTGRTSFVIAVDAPGYSGMRERTYDVPTTTRVIEVTLSTLDEIVNGTLSSLDYIKIDAEGAEWEILKGARRTLQRYLPILSFEFGEASYAPYGVAPGDVHDFLGALSYSVYDILGRELSRDGFVASSRRQELWDYVAIPSRLSPAPLLRPLQALRA